MNATQTPTGRYGRKEAAPAVLTPNKDETKDAFLARAKTAKATDADALKAWENAHPAAGENEMTTEAVQKMIADTVNAAFAAQGHKDIDQAALAKAIADEMAKQKLDSKSLTADQIKALAAEASKTAAESFRKEAKNVRSPGDANQDSIEIPFGWTKGNLTVHAKQLLNSLMQRPANQGIDQKDLDRSLKLGESMIERYRSMAQRGQKALTSTGAGTGDEFVPSDLSAELQRRFYLSSDLAAALAASEVEMPTQPYEYPLSTTRPTFFLGATESTATTGSTPGTSKITLNAAKLMGQVDYSYEVDEDSIVPILNTVETLLSEAAAAAFESVIINGDTTGTHQDYDTQQVATAAERAFKGFRKLALAVAGLKKDLTTGGINEANLRAMKKIMGKYGLRVRDLMWICGPMGKNDIEAISNVSTLEKYGPKATILTGELSSFLNIPIIGSEACREDVNASGVNDVTGANNTKGTILLVNKNMFLTGRRRQFTIETFRNVQTQQNNIVASFRKAFVPVETPSATIPSVVVGYNYTV